MWKMFFFLREMVKNGWKLAGKRKYFDNFVRCADDVVVVGRTEYLEKLKIEVREVDAYDKPFNEDALSDERLGIPAPEQAEDNHN